MEIKIIISDTGAAAEARVSSQPQVSGATSAADSGPSMTGGATRGGLADASSSEASPPPELLRQAAAIGASNGGPAPPILSSGQQGAPQPFIASRAAEVFGGATGGAATHESAGAAPGSTSPIDTGTDGNGGAP